MPEQSGSEKALLRVDFQPIGRRLEVQRGTSLLEAAQSSGVQLVSLCGGVGSCDGCKVRLVRGRLTAPTLHEQAALEEQELNAGWRLACQAEVLSDVTVDIPPESLTTSQRLQVEGLEAEIELDPLVVAVDVTVEPPTLEDLRADTTRVSQALERSGYPAIEIGLPLVDRLSMVLREQGWAARLALRGDRLIGALPPGSGLVGLAVDIGTTKLAGYLVDLSAGDILAKLGAMNPQIGFGEDVVSRIVYANQGEGQRSTLRERLVDTLQGMIDEMCLQAEVSRQQIVEAVVVGNTAMHHLFLGLPVRQLALSPYVPAVSEAVEVRAGELGLELAPGAQVYLPPNIAGFVGADHVAMVLATGVWQASDTVLALDIGTNTEVSLAVAGRLLSCSCASGPAFEGAHIQEGMRAAPGAIERLQISGGQVRYQTIDGAPAVGICGSGILDAVAEMLGAGMINGTGRLHRDHPLVRMTDGRPELLLTPADKSGHGREIVVTQKDVHEIQLAKGAIRAGIELLLDEAGLQAGQIDRFIVAGAFGTYIDVRNAIRVGMFPDLPLERFSQVGNAAGAGARQLLLSGKARRLAEEFSRKVEYVELARHPRFSEKFLEGMGFNQ